MKLKRLRTIKERLYKVVFAYLAGGSCD